MTKIKDLTLIIEILERRLVLMRTNILNAFLKGDLSIRLNIFRNGCLKLLNREDLIYLFQELKHDTLNYEVLKELIKLGDIKAFETLRERFINILKNYILLYMDNYLRGKNIFPENLKLFLINQNIWDIIKNFNKIPISEIIFEIKELLYRIPFIQIISLVKELSKCDYLFELIPIEEIKDFELEYPLIC